MNRIIHQKSQDQMKSLLSIYRGDKIEGSGFSHLSAPLAEDLNGAILRMRKPDGSKPEPMALVQAALVESSVHLDFLGCSLYVPIPRSAEGEITGFNVFANGSGLSHKLSNGRWDEWISLVSIKTGVPDHKRVININGFEYPTKVTDVFGTLNNKPFSGISIEVTSPQELNYISSSACTYCAVISSGDTTMVQSIQIGFAQSKGGDTESIRVHAHLNEDGDYVSSVRRSNMVKLPDGDQITIDVYFNDGKFDHVYVQRPGLDEMNIQPSELGALLRSIKDAEYTKRIGHSLDLLQEIDVGLKACLNMPYLIATLANAFSTQSGNFLDAFLIDNEDIGTICHK